MMSEFDPFSAEELVDSRGLFARAGQWQTRLGGGEAALPGLDMFAALPTDLPLLTLPPETIHLGRLALLLAPDSIARRPHLVPAPVELGKPPAAWLGGAAGSDLPRLDLTGLCTGECHPAAVYLTLRHILYRLNGEDFPRLDPAPLADLDRLTPDHATGDNPAKQLARGLHERVPLFWGSGAAAELAQDWRVRQLWYAERLAWAAAREDVAMLEIVARLPRYLPNTAVWVQLVAADPEDGLDAALRQIATRRRVPVYTAAAPVGITAELAVLYLLELGEWVALYAAHLNNVDPGVRVPHQILF